MPSRVTNFADSFRHAGRGVSHVLKNERNARIHLLAIVLVTGACTVTHVSAQGFAAAVFAMALVFFAEIVNSALEKTLDLVHPEHDERVRVIKDMAAGGVLVSAVAAIVIAVVVFSTAINQ